jgi:(R,R)-butanediol dehydrogenase/meso-butanediol dehydrogenase/diacetyl reductase
MKESAMRAARFYGVGDVRVEDVPEPEVGPRDVKVQVSFNGICGSDLHEFYEQPSMVPMTPHPVSGVQAPVILGHEAGGRVVAVGDEVGDLAVGTLVAIEPIVACGTCPNCVSGEYNLCERMVFHGYSTHGGGLAEYTAVDRSMVHPMPASLTGMHAALVEPMAVAYHAVDRARVSDGDLAVVLGAGPIGLGAVFALQALGATVVVSEPSEERRAVAKALGVATAIDPTRDDLAAAVGDLSNGRGARAAIDAAGSPKSFDAAMGIVGTHGTVVMVAVGHGFELSSYSLMRGEKDLRGSVCYNNDFPRVIESMAAGHYPLEGWTTTIPLADIVERGFEPLRAGAATKVLVDPSPDAAPA